MSIWQRRQLVEELARCGSNRRVQNPLLEWLKKFGFVDADEPRRPWWKAELFPGDIGRPANGGEQFLVERTAIRGHIAPSGDVRYACFAAPRGNNRSQVATKPAYVDSVDV